MTTTAQTVFVVDDSPAIRRSLSVLLRAEKLNVETYASGRAFLAAFDPGRVGCLVLDLQLRGEHGLDLLDEVRKLAPALPIIVLTGHGSVTSSVRALKAGAVDFFEKPAVPATLLARIRDALDLAQRRRKKEMDWQSVKQHLDRLTPRERQVLGLLAAGKRSKEIAEALGLSIRTVEGYRSRVILKMHASSATDVVSKVLRTTVVPRP